MAAALQHVAPPGRAALILCDLFGWPAGEAAAALRTGERELQTDLAEARETMARHYPRELGRRVPPPESEATVLSMRYLHAWETADTEALTARLSGDVVFQSPPSPSWYRGTDAFGLFAREHLLPEGSSGHWRMLPLRAGGQLGFGTYRLDPDRLTYRAHSIQVLFFDDGLLIDEIVRFCDADLFPLFGLLPEVVVQGSLE